MPRNSHVGRGTRSTSFMQNTLGNGRHRPRQRQLSSELLELRQMLSVNPGWLDAFAGASITDVALSTSGDAVVTGNFSGTVDFDPGPGETPLTATNGSQGFVARYAATDGSLVWAREFSGENSASGQSLIVDSADNITVAGLFNGAWADVDADGSPDIAGAGENDTILLRFDAMGSATVLAHFGGDGWDYGTSLATDGGGNLYVSGGSNSASLTIGSHTLVRSGSEMSYLAHVNAQGNVSWVRQLDSATGGSVHNATVKSGLNGTVLVAARYDGSANLELDAAGNSVVIDQVNPDDTNDSFIAKYDVLGELLWTYAIDAAVKELAVDSLHNVYGVGNFRHLDDFDPDNSHPGDIDILASNDGSLDAMVLKLDANGAFQKVVALGGSGEDGATARLALADNDHIYVTGPFQGTASFGTVELHDGGTFLTELDAVLSVVDAQQIGNAEINAVASGGSELLIVGDNDRDAVFPTGQIVPDAGSYVYNFLPNQPLITGHAFLDINADGVNNDSNRAIDDDVHRLHRRKQQWPAGTQESPSR